MTRPGGGEVAVAGKVPSSELNKGPAGAFLRDVDYNEVAETWVEGGKRWNRRCEEGPSVQACGGRLTFVCTRLVVALLHGHLSHHYYLHFMKMMPTSKYIPYISMPSDF